MRILRELSRRKLRTSLTITGITIGIWALVVFSSLANQINGLVGMGSEYFADKIVVTDGVAFGSSPMRLDDVEIIAGLDGVGAVQPKVEIPWDPDPIGFGAPDFLVGTIPGADAGFETLKLELATGRQLIAEDTGNVVVLGSTIARKYGVVAGGTVDIRGESFEVLGTLQPTLSSPDTNGFIPLSTAQALYLGDLPPLVAESLQADELANQIVVFPEVGADPTTVAAAIEAAVENSATMTGAEFSETVGATTVIFNAIIIGVAAISLIVGGLSVINTMAMSVAERTREIGIRRAIGGSRRRIVRELVAEAGVIGLLGGLIGLGLGAAVVVLVNEAGRSSGTVLFDLTEDRGFAVGFSTILGMVAGIIPAWTAARLDSCRPALRMTNLRTTKERTMNLIEATDLRKTYRLSRRTSIDALQGVDVSIAAGEMVAIMGPSRLRKSTLMHLLGLLHAPDTDTARPRPCASMGSMRRTLSDGERTSTGSIDRLRVPVLQPGPDAHRRGERGPRRRVCRRRPVRQTVWPRAPRWRRSALPSERGTGRMELLGASSSAWPSPVPS